ncbi:vacuolar protein sorting-associated protein 70 [Flagelloscypha sp. PMI_526]|nr:vacuolar protein sorting-associated protein 70 [Flagelloscypha sp. PMI_526]
MSDSKEETTPFLPVHHKTDSTQAKSCPYKRLGLVGLVGLLGFHLLEYITRPPPDVFVHPAKSAFYTQTDWEQLFLSIPNGEDAIQASRAYAGHPHLAGSKEDFADAKVILKLFQREFGISELNEEPIFKAGSTESRNATLNLSERSTGSQPTAWIDTYFPYMNTPLDRTLEILDEQGSPIWEANLVEEVDPLDPDAHKYQDYVPTWHGLSKNGSAIGELVYANYGSYEDYQNLKKAGVDLAGKIVLVRYGGLFRGLKIKGAEELGASAVLIFSDPRDDGLVTVKNGYQPYPLGPARAPTSVQRGSVQYLSMYPGDPTTEGYPSYENATRQAGRNVPSIPSLPISWANAERLLEEIGEIETVPDAFGHVQLTGKASTRKVKVVNHVDDRIIPIFNSMAAIPGHIRNEVVVLGCHRDAWVLGAADPISGTVSLHEIIRGFGALLKQGWKPLRTILVASWDAEEYGLIGSTEYGEDFSAWLKEHAVAYLNVDVSVSGSRWSTSASPSLANLIHDVASEVPHPTDAGRSLWDARHDSGPFVDVQANFIPPTDVLEADTEKKNLALDVSPLGSGSDYSTFLQHLGIASSDSGFGGSISDAPYHYHSIYDSQRWQEIYADPPSSQTGKIFPRHVAVAQHLGLLALRIIDSIVLPLNTTFYSSQLETYLSKVKLAAVSQTDLELRALDFSRLESAISTLRSASIELDTEKHDAEKKFRELLDKLPKRYHGYHPKRGLRARLRRLHRFIRGLFGKESHSCRSKLPGEWKELLDPTILNEVSERLEFYYADFLRDAPIEEFIKAAKRVAAANSKLSSFEKGFIHQDGIKEREWYRHLGVAPGKWLGYGASTFPALTEAISIDQDIKLAKYEIARLSEQLETLAKRTQP